MLAPQPATSHLGATFIILFVIVTSVAIAARWLKVPYTVALVVAGLGFGALGVVEPPRLTHELMFGVFLPGLIFEAAFHLEWRAFWRNRLAISALAVPGVIATTLLVALFLAPAASALRADEFGWRSALVFGALIAATDPVAVVALFRRLSLPGRLGVLLEAESLLNDGTAVVFFTLILGAVTGGGMSAGKLAVGFVAIVGGGALIGLGIGLGVAMLIKRIDDAMVEITLTTIAAYGSFLAAESVGASGVIATVAAGMVSGNYAAHAAMSPSTRIAVASFWEYVGFALNSIVFLLIGFEVRPRDLLDVWPLIAGAFLAVTLGRGIVVALVAAMLRPTRERIPRAWAVVLGWGGLRGALAMVLALSLPATFPGRALVVTVTYGVVVLSILAQGLSMPWLLHRLGIARADVGASYERARVGLQATTVAFEELDAMAKVHVMHPEAHEALRLEYGARLKDAQDRLRALHVDAQTPAREEMGRARRRLLIVERDYLMEAFRQGGVSRDVYDAMLADVDARWLRLETERTTADEPAPAGSPDAPPPGAIPDR